jgi:hypothetical protein
MGLRRCAFALTAAATLALGVGTASADTYTYDSYTSYNNLGFRGITIKYPNPSPTHSEDAGYGMITLVSASDGNLNVFCVDVYDFLLDSATAQVGQLQPGPPTGLLPPNPQALSQSDYNKIGDLVLNATALINSAIGATAQAIESAAIQLAIWKIEYGTTVQFLPWDGSTVSNLADSLIASADGATARTISLLTTTVTVNGANQQLIFIADCGPGSSNTTGCGAPPPPTPLPGALPLMASGLGALGLLGWRKRRKSASRAA